MSYFPETDEEILAQAADAKRYVDAALDKVRRLIPTRYASTVFRACASLEKSWSEVNRLHNAVRYDRGISFYGPEDAGQRDG